MRAGTRPAPTGNETKAKSYMDAQLPQRKKTRLNGYDYSLKGAYFITICTKNMEHFFGEVAEDKMLLNPLGQLVDKIFRSLSDEFTKINFVQHIIMPNHLHCLLLLNEGNTVTVSEFVKVLKSKVITEYSQKVKEQGWQTFDKTIWQRGFHDHIVRNGREFEEILKYIVNNPMRWNNDCFNTNHHIPTHKKNVHR